MSCPANDSLSLAVAEATASSLLAVHVPIASNKSGEQAERPVPHYVPLSTKSQPKEPVTIATYMSPSASSTSSSSTITLPNGWRGGNRTVSQSFMGRPSRTSCQSESESEDAPNGSEKGGPNGLLSVALGSAIESPSPPASPLPSPGNAPPVLMHSPISSSIGASVLTSTGGAQMFGYKRETSRRIFVNRTLRLDAIKFIGFDMDYTLAQYRSPQYESLEFRLLLQRLVALGYPEGILQFEYDVSFALRGLWFDKLYGNLLKVDPYGNILACCHGFTFLRPAEVLERYPNKFVQLEESRFFILNTLFNLPECYLYACLVDYFAHSAAYTSVEDKTGVKSGDIFIPYKSIFQSVRGACDWLHTHSDLQKIVMKHVNDFVSKDDRLPVLLDRIRENGKRAFLLTNSGYAYTQAIMSYLLDQKNEKGEVVRDWTSYFDYVVVDACKPLFFEEGTILRVVDRETRIVSIGSHCGPLKPGVIYSGGNCDQFSEMISARGRDVLYIGDHIYGDILKSKKKRGWRTFLVVPELIHELFVWKERAEYFFELQELDASLGEVYRNLDSSSRSKPNTSEIEERIREVSFNMDMEYGIFGSLFRSGYRQTFFAAQVMRYSDVYSFSFLNLLYYPFCYFFRAPFLMMPHESTEAHLRDENLEKLQNQSFSRSRASSFGDKAIAVSRRLTVD